MCPVKKLKEWLFGTHERKEEKSIALRPEEHLHPHEHHVVVYEEKPPALLHLRKEKTKKTQGKAVKKNIPRKKKVHAKKVKRGETMVKKKAKKKKKR